MSETLPEWAPGSRPFRLPAAETNSGLRNFVAGWMQQSFLARTAEEYRQRLEAFGAWAPPPVAGYNPYADPAELRGYEDSLHLFRDSRSPEETAFLKRRVDALRERARELEGAGFLGQFLAGMLTPENLLTLPLGIGGLSATTRLGRAAQAAGRTAALTGGMAAAENVLARPGLPTGLQGDLGTEVALSALLGAALGGAAGLVSARSLDAAAWRHALAHDLADGLRTPGARPRAAEGEISPAGASPAGADAARVSAAAGEISPAGRSGAAAAADTPEGAARASAPPAEAETWLTLRHVETDREVAVRVLRREGDLLVDAEGRRYPAAPGARVGDYEVVRVSESRAAPPPERTAPPAAGLEVNLPGAGWARLDAAGRLVPRQVDDLARGTLAANDLDPADAWGVASEQRLRLLGGPQAAAWRALARSRDPEDMARAAELRRTPLPELFQAAERLRHEADELHDAFLRLAARIAAMDEADPARRILLDEAEALAERAEAAIRRADEAEGAATARAHEDLARQATGDDAPLAERLLLAGANDDQPPPPGMGRIEGPPAPEGGDRLAATGTGAERARMAELPYYRLKNNRFVGEVGNMLARLADQIVQIPGLRLRGNAVGHATDTASVEARAAQAAWRYAAAERRQAELYYAYRGWDPARATPGRARFEELREGLTGRPEGVLSFAEFDRAVGLAVATGEHRIPQVVEAARFWREHFYEPFEREGAEAGVLLSPRHREAAEAALRRERDVATRQLEQVEREIDARAGITPEQRQAAEAAQARLAAAEDALRAARAFADQSREALNREGTTARRIQMAEAAAAVKQAREEVETLRAAADARLAAAREKAAADPVLAEWLALREDLAAQLADLGERAKALAERRPKGEPYVPHNWIRSEVRRRRDELARRIADWWEAESGHTWASSGIRAEVAISHLLREGIGPTVERVLRRHLVDGGMDPELAGQRAAEAAAPVREAVARVEPSRLRIEIASALGRRVERSSDPAVTRAVEAALRAAGVRGEEGEDGLDRLVREIVGGGDAPQGEWGDRFRPGHARKRTIDLPTALIADFLDLSQRAGGAEYARRMGAAIAMSRKFGDPSMLGRLAANRIAMLGEVAAGRGTVEEARAVTQATRDLRDKVLGTLHVPEDPDALSVRAIRFLINNAVLTQLGGGLKAQIADLGRIVMAVGFRQAFGGLMDSLGRQAEAFRRGGDEAAKAGAALELVTLGRARAFYDMASIGADHTLIERWARSGAETMMFVNLMVPWTNWAQRFAGALIQGEMVELAAKVADGEASADEIARLAAYGIGEGTARRIAAEWRAAGAERHGRLALANTDAWADAELREQFRAALKTAVDAAVMRPTAADRPGFLSRPLGQMLFLYKGFAVAATQRMLMAGLQQRDARVLAGVLSSIAIAWLVAGPAGGEHDRHPLASWERLFSAIERSGASGILGDLNTAIEMLSGNAAGLRPLLGLDPPAFAREPSWAQQAAAIGGPALAPWLMAVWALTDPEATGNQVAGALRRTLWFNNLIYVDWLFRALAREAGTAMQPEPAGREPAPALSGFLGGPRR
ncbi:hypothetical protein [Caldovatus aquaticus]|uniref:Uncharacterized protein n=1 Tax=Caldovatus aquaticus TaxID=2865671 RepID=A0ABS7EYF5_9PROT|nr:hypothetical protein [Caldovatus aquaticus]MBW8268283.1 hypothetical protein [Caldovatus aquaticus]